ncbi:hypothetical protein TM1040_3122 (plasmid) [Ruegeria sp. TM1040]|uniref:hypothetical protein n=1 Tax=Ruegeria sp. (strain TM1040) TaxID=292414 RepID=UPI0000553454|nr:hypothetical protein [Ruegeria sp. TM1040]ABF62096.1 hypothetical protein TM1040_3122 [Ruegeria sp. TM1040]
MTNLEAIRKTILAWHELPNVNQAYTLHYDETNNIRTLFLTPDGLNVCRPDFFVLGGVAHRGRAPHLDFSSLSHEFHLQRSASELKLNQLGNGDFSALLKSKKITAFLHWLVRNELFVHFQVLDPLYWSIVDVIDSILTEQRDVNLMMAHAMLKNALYAVLRTDLDTTAALLGRFNFPDVGRARRCEFIAELGAMLDERRSVLPAQHYLFLREVLRVGARLRRLPYLEDEKPNILINGFGDFYLHRIALFRNATHILDIEPQIANFLRGLDLHDGGSPATHFSFVNSKQHAWIQVSDAITGLLGKFFKFVSKHTEDELEEALTTFNSHQQKNLMALTHLLRRSIGECPGFTMYVLSQDDQARIARVLSRFESV